MQMRAKLGISGKFSPWTGRPEFVGEGIPHTPRVLDLLDVAASERLSSGQGFNAFYCDCSQSHSRAVWTRASGANPTFTTSTLLYAFHADRIVLPWEMCLMHGFPASARIPASVSQGDFKRLIGNGMSCPCVAVLLWGLHVARHRNFEAPLESLEAAHG